MFVEKLNCKFDLKSPGLFFSLLLTGIFKKKTPLQYTSLEVLYSSYLYFFSLVLKEKNKKERERQKDRKAEKQKNKKTIFEPSKLATAFLFPEILAQAQPI